MSASLRDPTQLQKLPVTRDWLERFRLHAQRHLRADLVGSQLNRRQGQSREFLELAPYVPGDDARTIDWRASLRYKQSEDLLVRRYMAEQHYKLVISVDTRDTLLLPVALPKVQVALWLAEAIGWMALRGGHQIALHRLFGPRAGSLRQFKGGQAGNRLAAALRSFHQTPIVDEAPNLADLDHVLPPAAIWLILTDLYFGDAARAADHYVGEHAHKLAQRIVRAQAGWRWIILLDIDSWELEKSLVSREQALELEGYGLPPGRYLQEVSESVWDDKAAAVASFKQRFIELAGLRTGSLAHCLYPPTDPNRPDYAQSLVREVLQGQSVLRRLYMEET